MVFSIENVDMGLGIYRDLEKEKEKINLDFFQLLLCIRIDFIGVKNLNVNIKFLSQLKKV